MIEVTGGYTAGGYSTIVVTEKYDDVGDIWTIKANLNTGRYRLSGFGLNGYGYTAGGSPCAVEKYDDVENIWTTKTNLNTPRRDVACFGLNRYGYAVGAGAITEKYDDVADIWIDKANLNTGRSSPAGFSLNDYGYIAGGFTGGGPDIIDYNVTEKYDDAADIWTTVHNLNTARRTLTGFSLNGYGYAVGGGKTKFGTYSAITEKYDDAADIWTTVHNLNTARNILAGFSLNDYGYTAGGLGGGAVTEKYDDVVDIWTAKANLNTAKWGLTGFNIGEAVAAAAATKPGRPLRRSTGASVSGGMECGMGKSRR